MIPLFLALLQVYRQYSIGGGQEIESRKPRTMIYQIQLELIWQHFESLLFMLE